MFLVNKAMLDPTWVGPVVDYISNMKFAPGRLVQEGGVVVEGPPPHPVPSSTGTYPPISSHGCRKWERSGK